MTMMDPEARFLQNQEARTAAVRKHNKRNDSHQFWKELRGNLAAWRSRLEAILPVDNANVKTASDRQEALLALDLLKDECKKIQKEALATSELPISDLRLLHQEFTTCSQQLQDARNTVSPPTRFVFARYRSAWNEQEQKEEGKDHKTKYGEHGIENRLKKASVVAQGRTIQDLVNSKVAEDLDGTVRVVSLANGSTSDLKLSQSTSLVLQDLHLCQVVINASYHLLHLINLVDCTVACKNRIDGAVHVTGCIDTSIRVSSCHQLRIHDCQKLQCQVQVGSGPILEDSSGVTFVTAPGDETMKEVKDFNWFRSEPSPNYEVIEQESLVGVPMEVNSESQSSDGNNAKATGNESPISVASRSKREIEEDDDDEL